MDVQGQTLDSLSKTLLPEYEGWNETGLHASGLFEIDHILFVECWGNSGAVLRTWLTL